MPCVAVFLCLFASWVVCTQVVVGRWRCDAVGCKRMVEYDGASDALFNFIRKNKNRRWLLFNRDLLDKLFSFIITARSTYTAATRDLTANVRSFNLRRQDVVKLGTAMSRIFLIPPETARCPICGPNPEFIVIDGQALGCTDTQDLCPTRLDVECPVLDIPATQLCVVELPALRAAIGKVLRSSTPLTESQAKLLRKWHQDMVSQMRTVEGSAAYIFFHFFPLGVESAAAPAAPGSGNHENEGQQIAPIPPPAFPADSSRGRKRKADGSNGTLESALRQNKGGQLTLSGDGAVVIKPVETWRDRTGLCAPNFAAYAREDDGAWLAVLPCLQALLSETVSGMFHGHNERAVRLFANTLRLRPAGAWRQVSRVLDGVGFLASFLGRFAFVVDSDARFRAALGSLLLRAVDLETAIDAAFESAAGNAEARSRGCTNAEYCKDWMGEPTPADYQRWRESRADPSDPDVDDPFVSYEYFAGLYRVRPGIKDSQAAKRRVGYQGKDRHAANTEGEGNSCNKAFSIKCGLT